MLCVIMVIVIMLSFVAPKNVAYQNAGVNLFKSFF